MAEGSSGFSRRAVGGVAIVGLEVPGELTAAEAPQFQGTAAVALAGDDRVVVDLGSVGFVDSSGLSALVGLNRALAARGGELRLAAPNREVVAVLELTRLHRLFEIYDTVDEAVTSFHDDQ